MTTLYVFINKLTSFMSGLLKYIRSRKQEHKLDAGIGG